MLHVTCIDLLSLTAHTGQYTVAAMLGALQEMAHTDDSLAHVLWVLLLPIVWATLGEKKDQQVNLARPVIALIGKGYHERQASMRPNVVQVLLRNFYPSRTPPPPLTPSPPTHLLAVPYLQLHAFVHM